MCGGTTSRFLFSGCGECGDASIAFCRTEASDCPAGTYSAVSITSAGCSFGAGQDIEDADWQNIVMTVA